MLLHLLPEEYSIRDKLRMFNPDTVLTQRHHGSAMLYGGIPLQHPTAVAVVVAAVAPVVAVV